MLKITPISNEMYKNPTKSHYENVSFDTNVFMPKLAQKLLDTVKLVNSIGAVVQIEDVIKITGLELHRYLDANQDIDTAITKLNLQVLREAERIKNKKPN